MTARPEGADIPSKPNEPLVIGTTAVRPGSRTELELDVARLPTDTWLSLPVIAVNGGRPGPYVWLSAAIHGDELAGVEIIRRVMSSISSRTLAGSIVAVPVVNVFGLINSSRYLPDRRDLNRSFPGSARGSLAARIARLFMDEIVRPGSVGIDLHTAAEGRTNLPQIRGDLDDARVRALAERFAAPVTLHSRTRDGSLREAATRAGASVLLFEGGEPNRYEEPVIRAGVNGVLRVLAHLDMIDDVPVSASTASLEARSSTWVRTRRSGLIVMEVELGDAVERGEVLGIVRDAAGTSESTVRSPRAGRVIGLTTTPLVNQGDAVVHVAETTS